MEYLVTSVEKVDRATPWEGVTHIFCRDEDGRTSKMACGDVIHHIQKATARFYLVWQGKRLELELAHDAMGNDCLCASVDGEQRDVLLEVPDFRDGVD